MRVLVPPIYISTFSALPVLGREQAFRLLSSVGANRYSLLLGLLHRLVHPAAVAVESAGEVDIAAPECFR